MRLLLSADSDMMMIPNLSFFNTKKISAKQSVSNFSDLDWDRQG